MVFWVRVVETMLALVMVVVKMWRGSWWCDGDNEVDGDSDVVWL